MYIYNTLKKNKELLVPINLNKLKIYVCGSTVYDYCHIGHGRNMFIYYFFYKYLKHRGYILKYIRNITDIDKKIIKKSIKTNENTKILTQRIINSIHKDEKKLGLLAPDCEPKVSDYKNIIIYYINKLLKNDFAYIKKGNVFFKIKTHKLYGMLSNQTIKNFNFFLSKNFSKYKKYKLDFSLWKKSQYKFGWASPWSVGFPGWHIECSVLSKIYLGNKFDIHGGGLDLIFPHHENEKAQSELLFCKPHVNLWVHSGHLNVNNKKMSKSLHNTILVRYIIIKYNNEVINFFFLITHYRKSINFTIDQLDIVLNLLNHILYKIICITPKRQKYNNVFYNQIILALENDFNTVKAISILFNLLYKTKKAFKLGKIKKSQSLCFELIRLGKILGILKSLKKIKPQILFNINKVGSLILKRNIYKKETNFLQSDKLRISLTVFDIFIQDTIKRTFWLNR
ncbi:cysteine--tRNA ligase [Candidatus Portiera aleyrodidarum]|uniref:cysteine--tRNA ligase n=1 Tax=Candidatus Portiera aleyrodidarum TaxID=91844 RepID=UPI000C755FDB|nr:cysteine--tRNA ligase [Candidatus Portiera aleyrodidarum]AUI73331.1 cysteine--tRNA ligase [Candidatus Portiera aleyrodidarum]